MVRQDFGHIVNTSSAAGLLPTPLSAPYCTAKHAVVGLSLSLRVDPGEQLVEDRPVHFGHVAEVHIQRGGAGVQLPGQAAAATTGPATPAQGATPTSSPSASPPAPGYGVPAGSAGTITAEPASSSQIAEFTTLTSRGCSHSSPASFTLTKAKVNNNGWAAAGVIPKDATIQPVTVYFRLGSGSNFFTCGTEFLGAGIPRDVETALTS